MDYSGAGIIIDGCTQIETVQEIMVCICQKWYVQSSAWNKKKFGLTC